MPQAMLTSYPPPPRYADSKEPPYLENESFPVQYQVEGADYSVLLWYILYSVIRTIKTTTCVLIPQGMQCNSF